MMLFRRACIAFAALMLSAAAALAQGSQFPAGTIWGNDTAAQRGGKVSAVTSILDRALGSTRGAVIERGASGWAIVGPHATAGMPWVSAGAGADSGYGIAVVAGGGTGLAVGTSGGIPFYNSTTTMQSSAALAVSRIVFGGGAGAAPATGLGLGTSTQVLHGNAAGLPTWAAVSLTADVSGQLPIANGGCNGTTAATCLNNITPTPVRAGDLIYWNGSAWVSLGGNNSGTKFLQEDASGVPSWVVAPGTGTVTSAQIVGAGLTVNSGTCTITTTGTCTLTTTAATKGDQETGTSTTTVGTPARQQNHDSAAKAWASWVGSSGSLNASYNVSSVSRSGAGLYTVNFTTAFATANYECNISTVGNAGVGALATMNTQAAGSIGVATFNVAGTGGDPTSGHISCFGRQ